jgi:hypothetical protein
MRIFLLLSLAMAAFAADYPIDPEQSKERTTFQTGSAYRDIANLRSDVAIVYGIDERLPERIQTWRDRGYRIHVMTGVSWGRYQDYLYGRFDGINHEDEAQQEENGRKVSHGGDVYYMCPGTNFGKFLSVGVQRALDAGAEAIHLEEPEFWVRSGWEEGFKREWKTYYGEEWQAPTSSVDAQWRASKLKYFLYRRALQQVFDHVQEFNAKTGKKVRCYVPTHSLINYAHWRIVSPESSLARLNGCDGYIAQVWTGTSRTPNRYRGIVKERTFETAFLEYGAMHNLVRGTGRSVWFLNDPIEDNANHTWEDYKTNWESTLVASLFQPAVWQYEVAPWPERIFSGRYPRRAANAKPIPAEYATELQTVFNALNNMKQTRLSWQGGNPSIGVLVSDSLMFQRGDPAHGDEQMSHFYGLALPFLKRGMPVWPEQLENVTTGKTLNGPSILLLSYHGQKPLTPDVHAPLVKWVKDGGTLVMVDDDSDPYNKVREWWNTGAMSYATPREHLFKDLKEGKNGSGQLIWIKENPAKFATDEKPLIEAVQRATKRWQERNFLLLQRGPYIVAAGFDESVEGAAKVLKGRFVNLFDPELRVQSEVTIAAGGRYLLLDLNAAPKSGLLASACKAVPAGKNSFAVEGIIDTPAIMLLRSDKVPKGANFTTGDEVKLEYSAEQKLVWLRFKNTARARELTLEY